MDYFILISVVAGLVGLPGWLFYRRGWMKGWDEGFGQGKNEGASEGYLKGKGESAAEIEAAAKEARRAGLDEGFKDVEDIRKEAVEKAYNEGKAAAIKEIAAADKARHEEMMKAAEANTKHAMRPMSGGGTTNVVSALMEATIIPQEIMKRLLEIAATAASDISLKDVLQLMKEFYAHRPNHPLSLKNIGMLHSHLARLTEHVGAEFNTDDLNVNHIPTLALIAAKATHARAAVDSATPVPTPKPAATPEAPVTSQPEEPALAEPEVATPAPEAAAPTPAPTPEPPEATPAATPTPGGMPQ